MEIREIFGDLPTLETERLLLRKLALDDAQDFFVYASDVQVVRYTTWEAHTTIADSVEFLRSTLEHYKRREPAPWGIVSKADHRLIGVCGFNIYLPFFARAEIGYALARSHWGLGLMPEAARRIIAFGFEQMELHRVQAVCEVGNTASARVMEKVGMTYEGTLRDYGYAKGHFRNLKMYAILRREWV
jgi:[ribosomal protein S5]-alanine N-acetyltransferase